MKPIKTAFIFNQENLILMQNIISKYPQGREKSAILPLLDLAQRQNAGYLSKDVIEYISIILNLPVIKVYEVASFYSMFNLNPVGKHHIQICGTTPCWLMGAEKIKEACEKTLGITIGKTTSDNKFTLSEVECLGACVNAPVVQINDDYFENLTEEKVKNIIVKLSNK